MSLAQDEATTPTEQGTQPEANDKIHEERAFVLALLVHAGISNSLGQQLIQGLGVTSRDDLTLLRHLEPEFLLRAVFPAGQISPLEAMRLCLTLRELPGPSCKDKVSVQANLMTKYGAVDANTVDPTNKLLVSMKGREIYIPTYPCIIVRRLLNVDELSTTATFVLCLVFRFDFHGLPTALNELIIERFAFRLNDVRRRVSECEHETRWMNDTSSVLLLTIRTTFERATYTNGSEEVSQDYDHYADFPFDRLQLYLSLDLISQLLTPYDIRQLEGKLAIDLSGWRIRFNLHRFVYYSTSDNFEHLSPLLRYHLDKNVQLKIVGPANKLPNCEILRNLTSISFPLADSKKLHYTPAIHLMIPIIRHPASALRSMVFPLLALNLGTLLTLFMNDSGANYNDRLTNLITLMVALFAFLGYARSSMPDVPKSSWIDRSVIWSTAMAMGVMIDSLVAFLSARDNYSRSDGSRLRSNEARGGAFHFFWEPLTGWRSGRTLVRCFGFAMPIVYIQCATAYSLYTSYTRFTRVVGINSDVVRMLNESESKLGGNEKFSRKQYVHPKLSRDYGEAAYKAAALAVGNATHLNSSHELSAALEAAPILRAQLANNGVSTESMRGSQQNKSLRILKRLLRQRKVLTGNSKITPTLQHTQGSSRRFSLTSFVDSTGHRISWPRQSLRSRFAKKVAIKLPGVVRENSGSVSSICSDGDHSDTLERDDSVADLPFSPCSSNLFAQDQADDAGKAIRSRDNEHKPYNSLNDDNSNFGCTDYTSSPLTPGDLPRRDTLVCPRLAYARQQSTINKIVPAAPKSPGGKKSSAADMKGRRVQARRRRGSSMNYSLGDHPIWDADD